jgi:hypothetical protein
MWEKQRVIVFQPRQRRIGVVAFVVLVCATSKLLSSPLEVVLAGEQPFHGKLIRLSDDELEFMTSEGAPQEIEVSRFVRWSHPREAARRSRVLLGNGSELVADLSWTTDGSVQLAGDAVQIRTNLLGRVRLPRTALRGVLFDAARDPVVADRVLKEMRASESLKDDQVWLVNGDRLTGKIASIDGATATIEVAGDAVRVPLSNLSAVAFRAAPSGDQAAKWAIGLQDGTLLRASAASGDGPSFQAKLASGIDVKGKSLDNVAFLQNLAGDFTYLSDLKPIDYKHTPYFELSWPLAVDRNLLDKSLRSAKERYLKGLAMHSASRAAYRLEGNERKFAASIALDDTAGKEGSAIFRVYAVRNGKPELAFESDIVRGGEAPQSISVDIAGAQGLILLVDYADYGDQRDHANWLDARVAR